MSEPREVYRTKSGRILTDADIEALADEAERGYDVSEMRRYGAGSGWKVPRFFRSALFPLISIVCIVYVASQFIK